MFTADFDKWYAKDMIYSLCNRKQYFTAGTCEQYNKMFDMIGSENFTARDVAITIYVCSTAANIDEVEKEINEIYNKAKR